MRPRPCNLDIVPAAQLPWRSRMIQQINKSVGPVLLLQIGSILMEAYEIASSVIQAIDEVDGPLRLRTG